MRDLQERLLAIRQRTAPYLGRLVAWDIELIGEQPDDRLDGCPRRREVHTLERSIGGLPHWAPSRHAALAMLAAIDWPLTVQVIATVLSAVAAGAAWVAAKASHDTVRDVRTSARVARLEELHVILSVLNADLSRTQYGEFNRNRPALARTLALIRDPLPITRQLLRDSTNPPAMDPIEALCASALREVETTLADVEHTIS